MRTLTLDANVVFGASDGNDPATIGIVEAAKTGMVDLAVASRVEADADQDKDDARRERNLAFMRQFQVLPCSGRFDMSRWDVDVWDSVGDPTLSDRLQQVLFPGGMDPTSRRIHNKLCDLDGLEAHISAERDAFVTRDTGFLNKRAALRSEFGVTILTPEEVLAMIEPK